VEVFGGAGLEAHNLPDPVVVLADDLDAGGAVVVGDLLAVPGLGDLDAANDVHVLVPQPD
jgi:hypothetical protein